jgi:hypothetical protein
MVTRMGKEKQGLWMMEGAPPELAGVSCLKHFETAFYLLFVFIEYIYCY